MMAKSHDAPTPSPGPTALNKRQQVNKANRAIFLWVAIAAGVITLSLVALQFLVRQALFNQKIISAKSKTNATLVQNIENASSLKKNVDALLADTNLSSAKANEGDNNLKVILDALPTTGDTTTISNSLYTQVLDNSGASVESVTVGSAVSGTTTTTAPAAATPAAATAEIAPTPQPVPFMVTVKGSSEQLTASLKDLERVIRPFNATVVRVSAVPGQQLSLTIQGETYFLNASSVKLSKQVLKP